MPSAATIAGVAVALFVGTNLDDIVALALLNASSSATGGTVRLTVDLVWPDRKERR